MKIINYLILSLFTCQLTAAELTNLTVAQTLNMQQKNNALVIDIRTEKEWQDSGIIPDSRKLTFFDQDGKYDADKWLAQLKQLKSSPKQAVILVCRSGNRSGVVGNMLAKQLDMKNVYHLSRGIRDWIQAGQTVAKDCPTQLACK